MKVEIDVAHDAFVTQPPLPDGVIMTLIEENGPAGGNPVYHLTGPEDEIYQILEKWGYDEGEFSVLEK
jgi:hypothetical protein